MNCLDTTSPFFPLPDGLVITSLSATETRLVVHVACRSPTACCPLCQLPSDRIHGHYERTVADLPCAGRRVILALSVRKFVCRIPTCPRQIFTERLPDLVQSYARITNRLRDVLIALGLATSAEVCVRLAPQLGLQVSAPPCFALCAPFPALLAGQFACWALMTGRGKKARSTELCWSI
jgi:zinc-finger of transposase IS204/IS1001/IS1096/IS1165